MSLVRRMSSIFDPLSLDLWDPFEEFAGIVPREASSGIINAGVDWKETPERHVFKVDLPEVKKEEVKVEVEEGRVMKISGERSAEKVEKNDKWHRIERSSGKFLRWFRLQENAKMDEVNINENNLS